MILIINYIYENFKINLVYGFTGTRIGKMEIQQLKGFYYSTRLGSLTKAAEKMSITQSAVSQQIKSLEDELGVKLFNRFGPRKDLTPDGKIFFDLVAPVIQELANGLNDFRTKHKRFTNIGIHDQIGVSATIPLFLVGQP